MAKSGNYAGTIVEQIVRKLTKTQAFKDALENFNAQRNQPGTENPAGQTPDLSIHKKTGTLKIPKI